MMIPASAPSTPASQEPSLVFSLPFSYSAVSSPRYQRLPSASWAYQSYVSSLISPFSVTWSWTTLASTPLAIFFVLSRTVTTTREAVPSALASRYTQRLPGDMGQYGLSISVVNWLGSSSKGSLPLGSVEEAGALGVARVVCADGSEPPPQ